MTAVPGAAGRLPAQAAVAIGRENVSRAYARPRAGQAASSPGGAVFTMSAGLRAGRDLAAGRPRIADAVTGFRAGCTGLMNPLLLIGAGLIIATAACVLVGHKRKGGCW